MASAAGITLSAWRAATAPGRASIMGFTGSLQPMTPVELGKTSRSATPRRRAAAEATSSAASTPPGAQTFETLLFTTQAASRGPERRSRPTITGAPGKALRVNLAANEGVGASRAMSVSAILAGLGASTGVNSRRAVPTRKPLGRRLWVSNQARCAARLPKMSWVLGMGSPSNRRRAAGSTPKGCPGGALASPRLDGAPVVHPSPQE